MISAEFYRSGDLFTLRMQGHADTDNPSGNLICAAASGIFYALVGYLANECDGVNVKTLSPGDALVECCSDGESAMKQACIGLIQLALTYPDSVEVISPAWGWKITLPHSLEIV